MKRTAANRTFVIVAVICGLIGAAYSAASAAPPLGLKLLLILLPLFAAARWFRADAHQHGMTLIFDWGFLGYFIWPFYLPWYAFRTRGRRGWRVALAIFAGMLASQLGSLIGFMLRAMAR